MRGKQKSCLITSYQSENMPFFLQNSFLAILMLISRKLVQRRGIGEKCGFFATRRPSPKGSRTDNLCGDLSTLPFNSTLARFVMFGGFFKISFKTCLNIVETFLLLQLLLEPLFQCILFIFHLFQLCLMNTCKHTQYIPFCGDKRHMQFTFIEGMSNDQLKSEKALSDASK